MHIRVPAQSEIKEILLFEEERRVSINANIDRFIEFMSTNPSPEDCTLGGYYDVPCIGSEFLGTLMKEWGEWIPLIGPPHDDLDVMGDPRWHIHIDTRFIGFPSHYSLKDKEHSIQYIIVLTHPLNDSIYPIAMNNLRDKSLLKVRRMECIRSNPLKYPGAPWRGKLEEAYANHTVLKGRCPHRGILVKCGRLLQEGVYQCPGHGLIWEDDGKMIVSH